MTVTSERYRDEFSASARAFTTLVEAVRENQWSVPALGEWDVRALVGHTSRAFATVEAYLSGEATDPRLADPVDYFLAMLPSPLDDDSRARKDEAIAERGNQAGGELGPDPANAVRQLAARVVALVEATPDEALVATPAGGMVLANYLPTRTLELTVHSLDLARALQVGTPPSLDRAVEATCELVGRIAARRPNASEFLLMLTGRPPHHHIAINAL